MTRAWLVGLVAAVGCGGRARVDHPGEDWLAAIRIEGNRAIAADDLIPHLALQRNEDGGRALDPYLIPLDAERIRAAYVEHGYFAVTVTPRVDRAGFAQTVVFAVTEGRRAATKLFITGLPATVPESTARALVALADGAPFDYEAYDDAKAPLLALVQNAGYARAELVATTTADLARGLAIVRYAFTAGVTCRFGPVSIAGVDGDLVDAIRARVAFAEGERYSITRLDETRRALGDLGRFSTVRVDVDLAGEAPIVPVKISVALANRHEIKLGGGLGIDPLNIAPRLRLAGSLVPESHPLWNLSAEVRPAVAFRRDTPGNEIKIVTDATAQRLDLFHPRVLGELDAGFDYVTVEAYTSYGPHFRAGVSTPLGARWLRLRVGWLFEYLWFTALDGAFTDPASGVADTAAIHSLGLDDAARIGAYQQSIIADGRDNPIDARSGAYAELRAVEGTPYGLGLFHYEQLVADVRGYVPLPRGIVLAGRLQLGGGFGDVPITERFFSGGASTNRGFAERALAPSYVNPLSHAGVAIGGSGLAETSVELRLPISDVWGIPYGTSIFVDGGDVTLTPSELDLGNLHWAVGLGVWLRVLGIKIRIDVGYRLNRTDQPPESSNFGRYTPAIGIGDSY